MSEVRDPASLPICVVLDCNEWIRLKWLGSAVGLTFISAMQSDPTISMAIPEVLESELNKHRAETARALLDRLHNVIDEINVVGGDITLGGVITTTEEEIDVAIRERLSAIRKQVLYPEMDVGETRRALQRVNAETAPNGHKNQQMKDSLLWEACLSLSAVYRVFFVTGDTGFYTNRDIRKGLAANLAAETPVQEGRLRVFSSLEEAVPAFAPKIAVDRGELASVGGRDLIAARAQEAFRRSPVATDLHPAIALRGVVPQYLRTEVPHVFAVSFSAFFLINNGIEDRPHGDAVVVGQCRLDAREASIDAVTLEVIHWTLSNPGGGMGKVREVLDVAL
ncbi:hypothetical protein ABZ652_07220 [Micromonospora chalcea]|uniref:hypothetical protein n=1 Tax=Micromonospora chalcea TaxID=1874 RepID=UPI0033D84AD2